MSSQNNEFEGFLIVNDGKVSPEEDLAKRMNLVTDQLALQKQAESFDIDDFTIIISDEERQQERQVLREFAVGEYVAHNLAYQSFKPGQIVSIKEDDQITRDYQVMNVETGQGGITARIFVPTNNDNAKIHIAFTGTCDFATLHADLEKNAGEEAIYKRGNMDKILSQINDTIGYVHYKSQKPVEVNFAGHSLGGALAGHTMTAALGRRVTNMLDNNSVDAETKTKIVAENEKLANYFNDAYGIQLQKTPKAEREHFDKVAKFKIATWNKTGESKAVEAYSNFCANMIVEKEGKRDAVVARFGMVGGDSVQQTGEGTVLSDTQADVAVLKVDIGLEGAAKKNAAVGLAGAGALGVVGALTLGPVGAAVAGGTIGMIYASKAAKNALDAHTAYHFNNDVEPPAKLAYELHQNSTAEGKAKIKQRLQKKSDLLQNTVLQKAKQGLHRLGQGISGLFGRRKSVEPVVETSKMSTPKVR